MRTWRPVVRIFSRSRRLLAISLAVSVLQAAALVPVALLVRYAFDSAIPDRNRGQLALLGAAILGLYAATIALGLFARYTVLKVVKSAVAELRSTLLERLYLFPRAYFDQAELGRLHSMIVQDTERVDEMGNVLFVLVIPSVIVACALLVSLVFISAPLLALVVVIVPALIVLTRPLGAAVKRAVRVWQEALDGFSAGMLSKLRAMTLTKVYRAEPQELETGRALFVNLRDAGYKLAWLNDAYILVQSGFAAVAAVVVLVIGGLGVIGGSLSIGELLAGFAVLALVRNQASSGFSAVPHVMSGLEGMTRLTEILEHDVSEPYTGRRTVPFRGGVELDAVSFRYGSEPVLEQASLAIQPGEHVALTGPNGSGKTTVVALVLGLYKPQSGRLLAEGVAYDELDIRALRRAVGVVLQEPRLVTGSVRENIAYGRPDIRDDEILATAGTATAHDFIAGLPAAYDTPVGEDGEWLSSGQRQRISIARALVGRPAMIVLDEPTTYLDREAAHRVLDNLRELDWSPSIVIVTHEPGVIERADRVYELDHGRIAQAAPLHAYDERS